MHQINGMTQRMICVTRYMHYICLYKCKVRYSGFQQLQKPFKEGDMKFHQSVLVLQVPMFLSHTANHYMIQVLILL